MTDKIKQITEKIYNEGILKANEDADRIIAEAKSEAEKLVENANLKKAEIIQEAKKQAEEIKTNTESEIKLATRQFLSNLKQQIAGLVTTKQLEAPITESFADTDFIKKILLTMIQNWNANNQGEPNIKLLLPENDFQDFSDFIEKSTKNILNKGLEIQPDSKIKTGFRIGPKDGSYIISFTEKDFENYFKKYFKERTSNLLFGENQQE